MTEQNKGMNWEADFQFDDYVFEELSVNLNNNYVNMRNDHVYKTHVDMNVDTGLDLEEPDTKGWVLLDCELSSERMFQIRARMRGYFSLKEADKSTDLQRFLRLNGTTVMFPYLRSAITDITKVSNMKPMVLPLLDITRFVGEDLQEKSEER